MKKITRIKVNKLFGLFNHNVNLTHEEGITILHGPNGHGKTTLLKMIAAFGGGDPTIFHRIAFESFTVEFNDGSVTTITQQKAKDGHTFTLSGIKYSDGKEYTFELNDIIAELPAPVLDHLDRSIPGPYSRSGTGWRSESGKFFSINEIVRIFPKVRDKIPMQYRVNNDAFEGCSPTFFVETKRLEADKSNTDRAAAHAEFDDPFSPVGPSHKLRVEQYSADISKQIKAVIADYAKFSQELDRTFPARLVDFIRTQSTPRNAKELLEDMAQLENDRTRLMSLGFLDSDSGLTGLEERDLGKVLQPLTIYVDDIKNKLAIFSELAGKIGTLTDILNARFRYKKVSLNKDKGFIIKSILGEQIDLENLSSGEQHELVVNYELVFRAPKGGVILIDEPEISLHVGWQTTFLEDLSRILKLNGCYGIIATHSPVVIGPNWHLTTALEGPEKHEQ